MKPLNIDPAVQIRYAEKLTAEKVSRIMKNPQSKPMLPKLLDKLPSSIRDTVLVEVTKIAHSIATNSHDEAAILIFDYLEAGKAQAAEAIELWKYLIKTGQPTGSQSAYKSVQNDIANVDCKIYSAIYAASIELDTTGQLYNEYTMIRRILDEELERIRDTYKTTYPKPKAQLESEKRQYLSAMEKFTHNVTAFADQIIEELSPAVLNLNNNLENCLQDSAMNPA
ncbi:hypothetical protein G3I67_14445 [Orrella sp. NBD-18]|uniref:Uncharacterized protein n=1 Tax=Sheuella amnicola TaxID=2707330 RepID=A0A6B2R4P2_9BURK|nr:hypothetical protein [Sheuella amnicola]NDY84429.1 hypothetical protein [Sheuella amnicola]